MKKNYIQPATTTVDLHLQPLMDLWSVESDDVSGGGTSKDNFYRVRTKSLWDDDEEDF